MVMTKRQQDVLDAINEFIDREGHAPTVRELCRVLGLASPGSLMKHLTALEKEGRLTRTPGKNRTWKPTGPRHGKTIPLLGQIAAGAPILAAENWEADLPIDPQMFGCESTFALKVRGDSMIDLHIQDGDLAIIKPQAVAENGQIVAVLVDGAEPEATLKILRRKEDRVELHPANAEYTHADFFRIRQGAGQNIGQNGRCDPVQVSPRKIVSLRGAVFFRLSILLAEMGKAGECGEGFRTPGSAQRLFLSLGNIYSGATGGDGRGLEPTGGGLDRFRPSRLGSFCESRPSGKYPAPGRRLPGPE